MTETNIQLDDRIIKILKAVLNARCNYSSINVVFSDGQQRVDTIYVSPMYGGGRHLKPSGDKAGLDEVLSLAQQIEDRGDIDVLISSLEKAKRENLVRIKSYKDEAKDIDQSLTRLLAAKAQS